MKMLVLCVLGSAFLLCSAISAAQSLKSVKVAPVKNSYSGSREEAELSPGPDALERGGLAEILAKLGCDVAPTRAARLTAEQEKEYGAWQRMGLANGHLGKIVADALKEGRFPVGSAGKLQRTHGHAGRRAALRPGQPAAEGRSGVDRRPRGFQYSGDDAERHAGRHAGRSLCGTLPDAAPAAVRSRSCLALQLHRDGRLERCGPARGRNCSTATESKPLRTAELRQPSQKIRAQMERLSNLTDLIYIHIDMDVLDPKEVSGHSLTVAGGPTSRELAAALTTMFTFKKAAALGIASYPAARDSDRMSLRAAYALIEGAVRGIHAR